MCCSLNAALWECIVSLDINKHARSPFCGISCVVLNCQALPLSVLKYRAVLSNLLVGFQLEKVCCWNEHVCKGSQGVFLHIRISRMLACGDCWWVADKVFRPVQMLVRLGWICIYLCCVRRKRRLLFGAGHVLINCSCGIREPSTLYGSCCVPSRDMSFTLVCICCLALLPSDTQMQCVWLFPMWHSSTTTQDAMQMHGNDVPHALPGRRQTEDKFCVSGIAPTISFL